MALLLQWLRKMSLIWELGLIKTVLELLRPIRDMAGLDAMLLPKGVRPRALGQKCFWFKSNEKAAEVNNLILKIFVFCDVNHRC